MNRLRLTYIPFIPLVGCCLLCFVFSQSLQAHSLPKEKHVFTNALYSLQQINRNSLATPPKGAEKEVPSMQKSLAPFVKQAKAGMSLSFSAYAIASSGTQTELYSGSIWVKENFFRIFMGAIDAAYDGQYLKTIDSEQRTYTIAIPTQQELMLLSPLSLLQNPEAYFTLSYLKTAGKAYLYKAVPKVKTLAGISSIIISVGIENGMPVSLAVVSSAGESILYTIKTVQSCPELKIQDFTYSKKQTQGLELIDLR